jgi:ABC-2 type transport system ATP-binding protein
MTHSDTTRTEVLVAEGLRKTYGPRHALRGLSFTLKAGRLLGFLGPNGAGKTTSIRILTTIMEPDEGRFSVDGVSNEYPEQIRRRIGVLPESFGLPKQMTGIEYLTYFGQLYGRTASDARSLGMELLEEVGLKQRARSLVSTYSHGMRQRIGIARALVNDPVVVFLDEPTIGLDLVAKARFRDLIVRINEERGTTILLTSHDVSDIEQVARRVIVINHGRLIYDDRVSVMRRALLGTKVLDVRFEQPPGDVRVEGARLVKLTGSGAKLEVDTGRRPIRSVLDDLLDRYDVVDISVADPPLEEIVSHIYARPL